MARSGHTLIIAGGRSGEGGLGRGTGLRLFPTITWAPLIAASLEAARPRLFHAVGSHQQMSPLPGAGGKC